MSKAIQELVEKMQALNIDIDSIQNELDNIVQELEQVERNKRAIDELQDFLRDELKFYAFARTRKVE
tara:strand:+ start:802 stop:1002 length:201 start_codon:yes stop_codon:yes gene_type:complete